MEGWLTKPPKEEQSTDREQPERRPFLDSPSNIPVMGMGLREGSPLQIVWAWKDHTGGSGPSDIWDSWILPVIHIIVSGSLFYIMMANMPSQANTYP